MDNQNKNIQDILEAVNFIKDNAAMKADLENFVTKDEFGGLRNEFGEFKNEMEEFKDEMREFKNDVLTNFDSLTKLVKDFQAELAAMRSRVERLELKFEWLVDYLKIKIEV